MGILAPKETRAAKPVVTVPDSPEELTTPKFRRLEGTSALSTCDKHSHVHAVVEISRADWKAALLFCGNCARRFFAYEHTAHAVQENRQKGATTA